MGSLKKRLRQLDDGQGLLSDLPALVERAKLKKNLPLIPGNLVVRIISGWGVILSCFEHPKSETDDSLLEHWHCSCKLYPPGRSSDTADWELLGRITIAAAVATGMPTTGDVRALTDIATANPNGAFHFIWHVDGTPCAVLASN